MDRATIEHLMAVETADGRYAVPSTKCALGTLHLVELDARGHIVDCTDCPGWENGGRRRPCKHAGAVALALLARQADARPPVKVHTLVIDNPTTRGQLYRILEAWA